MLRTTSYDLHLNSLVRGKLEELLPIVMPTMLLALQGTAFGSHIPLVAVADSKPQEW